MEAVIVVQLAVDQGVQVSEGAAVVGRVQRLGSRGGEIVDGEAAVGERWVIGSGSVVKVSGFPLTSGKTAAPSSLA